MNEVIYSLYIDDNGIARTGLSPSIVNFIDVNTGADVISSAPEIEELSGGFYKFAYDWTGASSNSAYVLLIDAGAEIVNASQRYIRMRIEQLDNVYNAATRIEAATASLEGSIGNLQPYIQRLLDIQQGTWKIIGNQLVVYSPENEELLVHDLEDENGLGTSVSPYIRRVNTIKAIS